MVMYQAGGLELGRVGVFQGVCAEAPPPLGGYALSFSRGSIGYKTNIYWLVTAGNFNVPES